MTRRSAAGSARCARPVSGGRPDPLRDDRLVWKLTSSGKFAVAQERALGVARAALADDTVAVLSARQRTPAPLVRVPPPRVRLSATQFAGGGSMTPRRMVGARLARLRNNAGWRQADLSRAAGVSLREVRRLEQGLERQDVVPLLACCRALGARLVDVVGP